MTGEVCPECGCDIGERMYERDGIVYCCESCAKGGACECGCCEAGEGGGKEGE